MSQHAVRQWIKRNKRLVREAEAAARDKRKAEIKAIVATGKCPLCGRPLRRNNALTGWWQCSQLGAVGFRADPNLPSCDWQGFTD